MARKVNSERELHVVLDTNVLHTQLASDLVNPGIQESIQSSQ